jgi:hypothetical protein
MKRRKEDTEGKSEFQKVGGGSLRLPGRIIKPNERFWAYDSEIPKGAWDVITRLSGTPPTAAVPEEVPIKAVKPTYKLEHRGGGRYNIVDSEGKVLNENSLSKEEAQEKLDQLEA